MIALIWALLFVRWFMPAEGTSQGDTLWVTMLTAGTAAAWAWFRSGSDRRMAVTGIWDRVVWWLVIAHVAAACAVLVTVGQKRAALTMIWEWTSVGLQFWLIRQTLTTVGLRAAFLKAALILWMLIAAYGLWQNFIGLPNLQRHYHAIRTEITELQQSQSHSGADALRQRARLNQLIQELVSQGVPIEGHEVGLFERRLESRDLIGFFALANSFGGMLATAIVLSFGLLISVREQRRDKIVLVVASAILVLCLLLTKTRTAWCGALAGSAMLGLLMIRSQAAWRRRLLIGAAGIVASLMVLVLVAVALGGLDRQVLSEAPKSLGYRWQYWSATLSLCREFPWLGVGPGNFRHHYLQHRLPGASEEIADPHQMVLDVAANAGVCGLVPLFVLLGLFGGTVLRRVGGKAVPTTATASTSHSDTWLPTAAIGLATLIVVGWHFVVEASFEWDRALVGGGAGLLAWLMTRLRIGEFLNDRDDVISTCSAAAATALLVHLSGAGGFASPAILNWLLALMALVSLSSSASARETSIERPVLFWRIAAVSYLGLTVVIAQLGWLPVLLSQANVTSGDQEFVTSGRLLNAASRYQVAADADPLLMSPWLGLGRVAFTKWSAYGSSSSEDSTTREFFAEGVRSLDAARQRDPFNAALTHELATWWLKRFQRSQDVEHLATAIAEFEAAVTKYPTNSTWLADLARAQQLRGDVAAASQRAAEALHLDDLNHRAGHIDRYLPTAVAIELRSLIP